MRAHKCAHLSKMHSKMKKTQKEFKSAPKEKPIKKPPQDGIYRDGEIVAWRNF